MKTTIGLLTLVAIVSACSSPRDFARLGEDDIYYVPGKQSLLVQQIEKKTGETIPLSSTESHYSNKQIDPAVLAKEQAEAKSGQVNPNAKTLGMARYATQEQVDKAQAKSNTPILIDEDAEGYWIGGFRGSNADLEECVRIMNRYPEGFANFGNAHEIAIKLSFDPDWNVYTVDNRYWWFPSNTNIDLYSKLMFGNYPQYIWTVMWNNPRFDSYAFNRMMPRFGFSYSWGGNNWAWNSGYNSWAWDQYPYWGYGSYLDWRHDSWYWYNRYWNHGYGYPHYGHWHPNHGRPDWGHINKPNYKPNYATRTHYTNNRNARSYSTYSRPYRSNSTYDRNNRSWESSRNQNSSSNSGYNSGSYSRSSESSYGRSSTTRSGGHSGSREHKETGRRK